MLAVSLTGLVQVNNLDTGGGAVVSLPVRGAEVLAVDETAHQTAHVYTDAHGNYDFLNYLSVIPGHQISVTVVPRAFDKNVGVPYEIANPTDPFNEASASLDVPGSLPASQQAVVQNFYLDGSSDDPQYRQTVIEFAIFSVTQTFYDYAATTYDYPASSGVHPYPCIEITYHDGAGRCEGSATEMTFYGNPLFANRTTFAAYIGHEFGHCVAYASGFASSGNTDDHWLDSNQRAIGSSAPGYSLTLGEEQQAFAEGWADYFAAQAANASELQLAYLNLPSMNDLSSGNFFGQHLATAPGYGEDNEFSVARIFWNLTNDPAYRRVLRGAQDLEGRILMAAHANALDGLWQELLPAANAQDMAKAKALLGRLFSTEQTNPPTETVHSAGVSPVILSVDTAAHSVAFEVNNLSSGQGQLVSPPTRTLTTFQLRVYDGAWNLVYQSNAIDLGTSASPTTGVLVVTGTTPDGLFSTVTWNMDETRDNAWAQVRQSHGDGDNGLRHFVIAGSCVGSGITTGAYWSDKCNVTITPAAATVNANAIQATEGVPLGSSLAVVASFTDPDGPGEAQYYSATIRWGDGGVSTVTGTAGSDSPIVANADGGYDVYADHTYWQYGPKALTVSISDDGQVIATADAPVTVSDTPLTVTPATWFPPVFEGKQFNACVATMTDARGGESARPALRWKSSGATARCPPDRCTMTR